MNDTEKVFERLKYVLEFKKDVELAEFLEVIPQQISQMKKRNNIPYLKIIENGKLGRYKLDYVFLGVGDRKPTQVSLNLDAEKDTKKIEDIVNSKELAMLIDDLISYGNNDLYKNIEQKLKVIKDVSRN